MSNLNCSQDSVLFSMVAMIGSCGLNIELDPLFIFTLKMGITEVTIATIIARVFAVALFLWYYFSGKNRSKHLLVQLLLRRMNRQTPSSYLRFQVLQLTSIQKRKN